MFGSDDNSPASALSSEELILLALQGDEEGFTRLYIRYTPELRRYVGGLVYNPEDRDEVVAEAFVKAWQKLPQLRDFKYFRAWLYRIATNVAYDYLRREKIRRCSSLEVDGADLVSSLAFETVIEETELTKLALQEVPWKYRTCLLLSVEGKCSMQDIAEVVNISPQSVPTYIHLGRESLREAYHQLAHTLEERKNDRE